MIKTTTKTKIHMEYKATYKIVNPGQYIVWVTAMLQSYEDLIIAGMVKKGYAISVASSDGSVSHNIDNCPSILITFRADFYKEEISSPKVHLDVLAVLKEIKALYYSVVVAPLTESCYIGSNIIINPLSQTPVVPKSKIVN